MLHKLQYPALGSDVPFSKFMPQTYPSLRQKPQHRLVSLYLFIRPFRPALPFWATNPRTSTTTASPPVQSTPAAPHHPESDGDLRYDVLRLPTSTTTALYRPKLRNPSLNRDEENSPEPSVQPLKSKGLQRIKPNRFGELVGKFDLEWQDALRYHEYNILVKGYHPTKR